MTSTVGISVGEGWTEERVDKLRKLWTAGVTANEIAKRIHMSRAAVCGKADRLGLEPRKPQTFRADSGRAGQRARPVERPVYDPNRADRLLRRFSWEEPTPPKLEAR